MSFPLTAWERGPGGEVRLLDPVTLEVVRNGILSIAEEMRAILMRSGRSPLLKEAGDLSCALADASGQIIAQGRDLPIHLGVMSFTVKEFLRRVPATQLRPGDVYYTNSIRYGGNHLPDVKAIAPVFHEGQLVAFAMNLAHWSDIGGAVPGSYYTAANEIYQEGLQIPPVRLFRRGKPDPLLVDLILTNVRGREEREGDMYAQFASTQVAGRRLLELFDRYGRATVLGCFDRILDESEERTRAELRALPDGIYEAEDFIDDDGQGSGPRRLACRIEIADDALRADFTGTDPATKGPVNTTRFIAASCVYYAVKCITDPTIPVNDGCYRSVQVDVPEGSLLNAPPEAPCVGGNHETANRAADVVFRALAQAVPDRVVAAGFGSAGVIIIAGYRAGRRFIFYESQAGGGGAGESWDGWNGIRVNMGNTMNTPAEVVEAEWPLRVHEHNLIAGSGGAGRQRGGLGIRRVYELTEGEAQLTTMLEREAVPPYGLFGGEPGQPTRIWVDRPDGSREPVRAKESRSITAGDIMVFETAGGGGYGSPPDRDPVARARDDQFGYV